MIRKWMNMTQVSLGRSLALSGAAAILGLILAGYALFTAKGTSTLIVPPEDVALVNQQPISRSDFEAALRTLYGVTNTAEVSRPDRKATLDSMIREELFVQRGKELDVAGVDPEVRTAMVSAVEGSIAGDIMAAQPAMDKLRAYYDAHRATYSNEGLLTARDLVFAPAAAGAARQALVAGQSPDAVAAQFRGRDSGRLDGQEFYFAAKIHLGPADFAAARPLAPGSVSAPIAKPDGIHLIYMVANTPPVPLAFEEALPRVRSDYQKDAVARVEASDATFLRKRANILVAEDMR